MVKRAARSVTTETTEPGQSRPVGTTVQLNPGKRKPAAAIVRAVRRYRVELVIAIAIILIEIILSTARPAAISGGNLRNVALAATPLIMLSFGELMVMITGGIDLSIGSIFSLSGIAAAVTLPVYGPAAAVAVGLAVGIATGLFNGILVGILDLAPFIVTLITLSVDASLAFVIANGSSRPVYSSTFQAIEQAHVGPIPLYIIYVIVILFAIELMFLRTTYGRWLYSVGSNERAARLLGVPVPAAKIAAYTSAGLLASFAAILSISYIQDAEVTAGQGLELDAIAAVVIGGASLFGGVGSALSAFVGAILVTVIENAVNLLGINSFYDGTVTGAVILLAILLERFTRRSRGRVLPGVTRWFRRSTPAARPSTSSHSSSVVDGSERNE